MNRSDPDAQLEASLRRIRWALDRNRNHYAAMVEQIVAATGVEVAERVSARIVERHQRRVDRWRRRAERRGERRRYEPADLPRSFVTGVVAIACLVIAVMNPALWWLVFVALGLGTSAARRGRAGRRTGGEREEHAAEHEEQGREGENARVPEASTPREEASVRVAAPPEPPDPKVARIQGLCDKLLAELKSGPPIVREVVTQPEATIGGLRQACLEIAKRERELRTVLAAQSEATLLAERDGLAARVANETDEIVRDRLGQASRALEQQLAHRAELATAATRLEAENTRILYTLESLHMQLLRARSTDIGAPELGAKLRDSLRALGTEIDAVAEALEWASTPARAEGEAASPTASAPATAEAISPADGQSADRQAAARRAAAQSSASQRRTTR